MAIEIKTALKDFHEVSVLQAQHYIRYLIREGLPKIRGTADKIAYIEANRLRGITVEELLKDKVYVSEDGTSMSTVQLTLNGEFVAIHSSQKKAAEAVGMAYTGYIGEVCKGKRASAHGYKWMRLIDYVDKGGVIPDGEQ